MKKNCVSIYTKRIIRKRKIVIIAGSEKMAKLKIFGFHFNVLSDDIRKPMKLIGPIAETTQIAQPKVFIEH